MTARDDFDDEKPLDPALEHLRRRMIRLLVISMGIMVVGLMAVLGTIVYRVVDGGKSGRTAAGSSVEENVLAFKPGLQGRLHLPAGSEILSTSLNGGNILVHVRQAGNGEQLLVYSLGQDRIIATVTIDERRNGDGS